MVGFLAVSLSCDCCGFGFAGFVRFSVWVGAYRGWSYVLTVLWLRGWFSLVTFVSWV